MYGCVGLLSIWLGWFLFTVLLKGLQQYGMRGYIYLGLFSLCLLAYLRYEMNAHTKRKIVNEIVDELMQEYQGEIGNTDPATLKITLREHLLKKIDQEKFVPFTKA